MDFTITTGCYERFLFGFRPAAGEAAATEGKSASLERCFTYAAHQGSVKCVVSLGNFIASGGADDLIHIYDLNSGADLGFLMQPGYGTITCLDSFAPKGSKVPTHLFSGGEDGVVNAWQAGGTWEHLSSMSGHKGAVSGLAVHQSGRVALSVGMDAGLRLWDLSRGKSTYASLLPAPAEGVTWVKGGEAYALLLKGKVQVRSVVGEGAALASFEGPKRQLCMASDDEGILLTGGEDGALRFWDLGSGSCPLEFRAHGSRVRGVVLLEGSGVTPRGLPAMLASASSDGTVKLWDVRMLPESGSGAKALAQASTSARLTCITASPGPAALQEMAIAQTMADRAAEAARKTRIVSRVKGKANASAEKMEEAETFEVVAAKSNQRQQEVTVEDAVSAPKKAKEASKGSTGAPVKKAGKQKKAGGAKKGPLLGPAKQPVQKKRRQPSK